MIVLDAYALLAYFVREPAGDEVAPLLRQGSLINAVNVAEVIDHLCRVRSHELADVRIAIEYLVASGLEIEPVDDDLAIAAGDLRARHYHRRTCQISLADCMAIASAKQNDLAVATSDQHLVAVARAEGIGVHALPDSSGERP